MNRDVLGIADQTRNVCFDKLGKKRESELKKKRRKNDLLPGTHCNLRFAQAILYKNIGIKP